MLKLTNRLVDKKVAIRLLHILCMNSTNHVNLIFLACIITSLSGTMSVLRLLAILANKPGVKDQVYRWSAAFFWLLYDTAI